MEKSRRAWEEQLDLLSENILRLGGRRSTGGTLNLSTAWQIDGPFALQADTLGGTGLVDILGLTTWTGGSMIDAGRTRTTGGLLISGLATLYNNRILENPAGSTATMTAEITTSFGHSSTIENRGLWDITNDADITSGGGSGTKTFNNLDTATFRKSGGLATSTVTLSAFNNTGGTVEVLSGTLLPGNGTHTGSFSSRRS